jgi:hypothetical protein
MLRPLERQLPFHFHQCRPLLPRSESDPLSLELREGRSVLSELLPLRPCELLQPLSLDDERLMPLSEVPLLLLELPVRREGSFRFSERPIFWPNDASESLLRLPFRVDTSRFTFPALV